jgi:carbamoyl-phosphate synthase large subunit
MNITVNIPNLYECLKNAAYNFKEYSLVPLRKEDIFLIKKWRNEQIRILRQKHPLSDADQERYFKEVIQPTFTALRPEQILFSFLLQNKLIGYGGLVHIDWESKRAEVSFLLDTRRSNHLETHEHDFTVYLHLIKKVAFEDLHFHRLHTETFDIRDHHIAIMERNGFVREGRLKDHVMIDNEFVDSLVHGCLQNHQRNDRPFHALVTSASKKIPLLRELRKALNKACSNGKIFGGDIDPECLARFFVDDFWLMPKIPELTIDTLIDYCREKAIKLIIPSRDGELLYFAKHQAELEAAGISVMISSMKGVKTCLDKLTFYEILNRRYHFPVIPATNQIDDLQAASFVVKERFGAGAKRMALNVSKEDAIKHSQRLEQPIFQPFVAGREYSVDAYLTRKGIPKGAIVRSRDLVIDGESQVTTTIKNEPLEQLCLNMAQTLKLAGHCVFQVIEDPNGSFHVVECNCRFGGASSLSVAAGLDSFYWALLEALEEDIAAYPFFRIRNELRQIRHAEDRIEEI